MTFAHVPEPEELAVRTLTPVPGTPDEVSISTDTTPTSISVGPDGTISEGQLVISHGEVRLKNQPGKMAGKVLF